MTKSTMWGGRFACGPAAIMEEINASIGFDRRLWRAGHRAARWRTADDAGGAGHHLRRTTPRQSAAACDQIVGEIEAGRFKFSRRARGHPHQHREPAHRAHRPGRPGGCTRRARATTRWRLDVRLWVRDAIDARSSRRSPTCSRRWSTQGRAHAATVMPGFTHLQAAQPVTFGHHLLAYVEMFGARPRPLRRCPRAAERMPARGGGARRHARFPIDRARDGEGAGLRRGRWPTRSMRCPTATSRSSIAGGRGDRGDAPVAPRRGDRDLVLARSSASSRCPTPSPPAARSCRRSAIPTRPSWCAPRSGASSAPSWRCCTVMKGLPLDLRQGHAGGQGAGVRRRRQPGAGARGDDRHGARPRARCRSACATAAGGRLFDGDRSCRLAGARARPAVPRGASRHRAAGGAWPTARAATSTSCSLAEMQAVEPRITADVFDVLTVESSVAVAAQLRRHGAGKCAQSGGSAGLSELGRSPWTEPAAVL